MILEAILSILLSLSFCSSHNQEYQEGQAYNTIDLIHDM